MSIVRAGRRTDPSAGNVGRSTTRLSSAVADCPTSKLDMISAAGTLKTLFISSPDCSFLWKGSRLLPCVHQQCANLGARIVFHMRRHIENHRCPLLRSEEQTSELQSLMRISYAVFCLKKKNKN